MTAILDNHAEVVVDLSIPAPEAAKELRRRIESRDAIVAVIGLGYVGLPLAVSYAEAGFRVVGIDLDARRVEGLREGISPVEDIPDVRLAPIVAPVPELYAPRPHNGDPMAGFLAATSDFDVLSIVDAVIICVPTPLSHTKDPDVSYIMAATDQIARRLHPGMLVVLESTTYPGTTEELVLPLLENPQAVLRRRHDDQRQSPRSPLVVGRDFFLAFSPERIDPGRRDHTIHTTPKVVGGTTPTCLSLATALYGSIVNHVVQVSNPKAAEMVKLLENTFRSVNIGLVNELAMWCDKLDIDVWEVIDAAATKPFGFMPFRPGPGLGGHCIPIDPLYLAWKLRSLDYPARFITLASEINMSMPHHVLAKIATALNDDAKAVRGSRVLVLGVAYKGDISDVRESPALDLIKLLIESGANLAYHDPYVPAVKVNGATIRSVDLTDAELAAADCVVIETNHSIFDWDHIGACTRNIVDTRNAMASVNGEPRARVVKL